MINLHIILTGKVYKVGLRYFIKQMAKRCGIIGTVRYQDDSTIAIDATGQKDNINHFLNYCRLGCPGSDIQDINIKEKIPANYQSFEILE